MSVFFIFSFFHSPGIHPGLTSVAPLALSGLTAEAVSYDKILNLNLDLVLDLDLDLVLGARLLLAAFHVDV